ncbi:MAG: DUF2254 domain-containing protein [Chitinophagaceae bacterium]|nr:DUF2254 domain-containing protein [Oligoflexus sp.]
MSSAQRLPKKLVIYFRHIRNSYWFIPSIMTCFAGLLAFLSLLVDYSDSLKVLPNWTYLFSGGTDGARDVVGVVAGSIITVAGVTFSISIVILSLAAQQYGSRLLRNFTRDRALHFIIGTFISTFVYCLVILPSVHSGNDSGRPEFIPRFSVMICILLAIFCVFALIYFIHHVSLTIQASFLSFSTNIELVGTLKDLYPEESQPVDSRSRDVLTLFTDAAALPTRTRQKICLRTMTSGYFQAIDLTRLIDLAEGHDIIISIIMKIGKYAVVGDEMLVIIHATELTEKFKAKIQDCFTLGQQRTMDQDPGFGFDMLVEMAIRALSPGINDPFTAIQCIDYLRDGLQILTQRPRVRGEYLDSKGTLRVVFPQLTFHEALERAIPVIGYYGRKSPDVLRHLIDMLGKLAHNTHNGSDKLTVKLAEKSVNQFLTILETHPD